MIDQSQPSLLPNVFIAGFRKSGTSSLAAWLALHPDVCASAAKGTEFLMDRDSPFLNDKANYHDHGLAGYGRLYPHYRNEAVILDATTRYADQQTALRIVSKLDPQPHVVFMVREPADRIHSAFHYAKNNLNTLRPEVTFAEFVRLIREGRAEQLVGAQGAAKSPATRRRRLDDLRTKIVLGQYVDQLLLWRNVLAPGKLHVYRFDDLKHDPRTFMTGVSRDLGLDPAFYRDFEFTAENESVTVRSRLIHKLIRGLAPLVPKTRWTRAVYRQYKRLQTSRFKAIDGDDLATLAELRAHYREYNERLAAEFSLDISGWNDDCRTDCQSVRAN